MDLQSGLLLVGSVVVCLYFYFSWKLNYYTRKGIPTLPAYPFVGSFGPTVLRRISSSEHIGNLYNSLKGHRFGGIFDFTQPAVLVIDPELIKLITIKDFDHFVDRNLVITEDEDELFGNAVFLLRGNRWRDMRATLSPAFTSSKMKNMFLLVRESGQQLVDFLETRCREEGNTEQLLTFEMKDLWTRYTNDVIASAAFGVQCDSLQNPTNEFYRVGKDLANFGGFQGIVFVLYTIFGRLVKFLGIPLVQRHVSKFLLSLVSESITTRERQGIVRPDMIHLLMQARQGELREEGEEVKPRTAIELSEVDITAQVMIFFLAGFDTTSTLLSFASNRLAVHEDVQRRVQEEIDCVLEECNNQLTYEAVQKMKYLDMVLSETMRCYPPVEGFDRKCVKEYRIPAAEGSPELVIEKGEGVWISVYGLHHDPEFFPEPMKFDPERFSEENKQNIKPCTYMPFGTGPRACIGMRFALMEVKIAFILLLSRFNLQVVEKTPVELKLSKDTFNVTVDGGFWLGLTPREK